MFEMTGMPLNRLLFNKYVQRGGRKLFDASRLSYVQLKLSAMSRWRLLGMPDFNRLVLRISKGLLVNNDELLPYLCSESKRERLWVNYCLANAFHRAGNHEHAMTFIRRAWNFSSQNEKYLPLFVKIHAAAGDVESIRGVYKALGMKNARAGRVSMALANFNSWQYAYAVHSKADEYSYDFEILDCITQLAGQFAFPVRTPKSCRQGKVRLAYLMFGMTHLNSVIVKNSLTFASFHDASRFDVTFFIPDQATSVLERKEAVENIRKIENAGWKVVIAPDSFSELKSLHEIARLIYEAEPDILVTNAALADFRHFYITALKPAPLVVGLCQGPPPQYIAPDFDWSISWTRHPMMDCPVDCTLVSGAVSLPERRIDTAEAKSLFGFAEDALIVMSCGRLAKFQNQEIWASILDVLRAHPEAHYVVVGLETPPTFLERLLTPDIANRVRLIARVADFHSVLSMADVVVDTYPSGGGMTVVDAMALGIPVVSFSNNYMKMFSQTDWSPAEEFMGMPELLVERGDFVQLGLLLKKLLSDHQYRGEMSIACKESIQKTSGKPEKMIRDCEDVYLKVLQLGFAGAGREKK